LPLVISTLLPSLNFAIIEQFISLADCLHETQTKCRIGIDPLADESEPSSPTDGQLIISSAKPPCATNALRNSRISMTPRNSGCGKRAQGEAAADSVTVDRGNIGLCI